jgi:hypothetical protein
MITPLAMRLGWRRQRQHEGLLPTHPLQPDVCDRAHPSSITPCAAFAKRRLARIARDRPSATAAGEDQQIRLLAIPSAGLTDLASADHEVDRTSITLAPIGDR